MSKQYQYFRAALLRWYDKYGRKDLPWQKNPTAYRVWVSEIMLQQTQVKTVIPYYNKFMQRFPSLRSLAQAKQDEVLHYWSGLGYYSRARNLHQTAIIIYEQHAGRFPLDIDVVQTLPGIGRSTAAAILALAKQQRHAILDGNVKRVLCRYFEVYGWPEAPATKRELWDYSERCLPRKRMRDYTQAIMDLGATVCVRSNPDCSLCPLQRHCVAFTNGNQTQLPEKKPKRVQPVRTTRMLIVSNPAQEVLLVKRPPSGIWGGLWSFPECASDDDPAAWCEQHLGLQVSIRQELVSFRHTFSHYHLDITPVLLQLPDDEAMTSPVGVMDSPEHVWYNISHEQKLGFAAPVSRLMQQLDIIKQ